MSSYFAKKKNSFETRAILKLTGVKAVFGNFLFLERFGRKLFSLDGKEVDFLKEKDNPSSLPS